MLLHLEIYPLQRSKTLHRELRRGSNGGRNQAKHAHLCCTSTAAVLTAARASSTAAASIIPGVSPLPCVCLDLFAAVSVARGSASSSSQERCIVRHLPASSAVQGRFIIGHRWHRRGGASSVPQGRGIVGHRRHPRV